MAEALLALAHEAAVLPIPFALVRVGGLASIGTTASTAPWWYFDNAEGYAAAMWSLIYAMYALGLGIVAAIVTVLALRVWRSGFARRLARLGGSDSTAMAPPRRRPR